MTSVDMKGSLQAVESSALQILNIWKNLGLSEDQMHQRSEKMWKHVFNLFREICDEETNMYNDVLRRVQDYDVKVKELSDALQLELNLEYPEPLIQKMKSLENELQLLTEKKKLRMKHYNERKCEEKKLCDMLNVPTLSFPSHSIPNQDDVNELQQHIRVLEQKVKQRREKFRLIKRKLTTILEETDYVPEDVTERKIDLQPESVNLSDDTFKILERALEKAESKKEEIEFQKLELVEKLNVLWQRLKFDEGYTKKFLAKHNQCRLTNIAALEEELKRCECLKNENLKGFVESLRQELVTLWDKCHIPESIRQNFVEFTAQDITDAVLEAHDAEVNKWKKYYDNVKHILTKIERWTDLFNTYLILEKRANDPGRFKNRNCNLLKEEGERKEVQRKLLNRALETEIFKDISKYESERGSPFLYDGQDFRIFVAKWEEIIAQKENDKILRKKQHLLQIQHEVTVGTPAERPMPTTPKSAPTKLFKSNNGLSLRTPAMNLSKKPPSTISKMFSVISRSGNRHRPNAIRKCDQDQKHLLQQRKIVQASASPNTTSYTSFAKELDKTVRCSSRSSVLATKKPGGSKISTGRKTSSKSLRRSIRNKSKVANPTPTKMHIGIPFII